MPTWLRKLLARPADTAPHARDGHDPEWAEFNLPERGDLQVLLRAEPAQDTRYHDT